MKNKVYTILRNEHKNSKGNWTTEINFYTLDFSKIDLSTDWRFKEIEGRRKQAELVGTISNLKFPIEYPVLLDNGIVLEGE